ncbi:MAG: rubredoxin [Eubacteriales bacterium]|nr:rubredoxin [Eubacteriales bacterium]
MKIFVCTICGFIYDEAAGIPISGIAAGTAFADLPSTWVCPLCRAAKSDFIEKQATAAAIESGARLNDNAVRLGDFTPGQLSVVFSNLAKGCEKQYRPVETALFQELSDFYQTQVGTISNPSMRDLSDQLQADLGSAYTEINQLAVAAKDRGTQRALTWGEKVSRMLSSLLRRFEIEQTAMLQDTNIFVCEICGFIYLGDEAPDICPVCKVPNLKISAIGRR